MNALLIDHDDSFTFNLRQWLRPLTEIRVTSHRDLHAKTESHFGVDLVVLSPGPKSPTDYPHTLQYIRQLPHNTAVFGVCLGLQMLVHSEGGKITPYSPPRHGKHSKLDTQHPGLSSLQGLSVARYHSLYCAEFAGEQFETLAVSADDHLPMWLKHRQHKWMGAQFHPESFLTQKPELHLQILQDWLKS